MESNILSHTLSNNSDKKINEGSHRKKKKIINKTNWTLFQYVGSCEIKRLSGHLLVRERLLILSSRKNEMLHASTVLFSFLQEVNTSRGSPCPQPFKFPNAPISIFLTNCAGGCGQQRASFCFNLTPSEEQRLLACHHWQFQICRQSNARGYLKVDSLWKQCMAWVLSWPKCGFIYKGQRGIAI